MVTSRVVVTSSRVRGKRYYPLPLLPLTRGDRRGAMALVGAAAVAAFAAALLNAPRLVASLVAAPGDGAE